MSQQRKLTEREVRFARALLRALHANETNGYLLLAIIAWLRGGSAPSWVGNNPLGLKDAKGHLMRFKTYLQAAQAVARRLQTGSDPAYKAIVKAAQRQVTGQDEQVMQAMDFMLGLALSRWDTTHFGMSILHVYGSRKVYVLDPEHTEKNLLVQIWAQLTGMHIPKKWFIDVIDPGHRARPGKQPFQQHLSRVYHVPGAEVITPYGARDFYNARPHIGSFVLAQD